MNWNKITVSILVLVITVAICIGIASYTFSYAKGLSYLSTDPKACVNCHVMRPQYDGWQKASHHTVATCADCHMPHTFISKYLTKAENGYLHSKAFTLQDYPDQIQIRDKSLQILNQSCRHCHNQLVGSIPGHSLAGDDNRTCTRCHSGVGH